MPHTKITLHLGSPVACCTAVINQDLGDAPILDLDDSGLGNLVVPSDEERTDRRLG